MAFQIFEEEQCEMRIILSEHQEDWAYKSNHLGEHLLCIILKWDRGEEAVKIRWSIIA